MSETGSIVSWTGDALADDAYQMKPFTLEQVDEGHAQVWHIYKGDPSTYLCQCDNRPCNCNRPASKRLDTIRIQHSRQLVNPNPALLELFDEKAEAERDIVLDCTVLFNQNIFPTKATELPVTLYERYPHPFRKLGESYPQSIMEACSRVFQVPGLPKDHPLRKVHWRLTAYLQSTSGRLDSAVRLLPRTFAWGPDVVIRRLELHPTNEDDSLTDKQLDKLMACLPPNLAKEGFVITPKKLFTNGCSCAQIFANLDCEYCKGPITAYARIAPEVRAELDDKEFAPVPLYEQGAIDCDTWLPPTFDPHAPLPFYFRLSGLKEVQPRLKWVRAAIGHETRMVKELEMLFSVATASMKDYERLKCHVTAQNQDPGALGRARKAVHDSIEKLGNKVWEAEKAVKEGGLASSFRGELTALQKCMQEGLVPMLRMDLPRESWPYLQQYGRKVGDGCVILEDIDEDDPYLLITAQNVDWIVAKRRELKEILREAHEIYSKWLRPLHPGQQHHTRRASQRRRIALPGSDAIVHHVLEDELAPLGVLDTVGDVLVFQELLSRFEIDMSRANEGNELRTHLLDQSRIKEDFNKLKMIQARKLGQTNNSQVLRSNYARLVRWGVESLRASLELILATTMTDTMVPESKAVSRDDLNIPDDESESEDEIAGLSSRSRMTNEKVDRDPRSADSYLQGDFLPELVRGTVDPWTLCEQRWPGFWKRMEEYRFIWDHNTSYGQVESSDVGSQIHAFVFIPMPKWTESMDNASLRNLVAACDIDLGAEAILVKGVGKRSWRLVPPEWMIPLLHLPAWQDFRLRCIEMPVSCISQEHRGGRRGRILDRPPPSLPR